MSFDDALEQVVQQNEQANKSALGRSAVIAHNSNPGQQGENNQKARKQGMPTALATPANGPVNMEDMNSLIDDFHKLKGKTADHMSDPDFAKVAKDDHEPLSKFEDIFSGFKDRVTGLLEAAESTVTGIAGAVGGAATGLATLGLTLGDVEAAKAVQEGVSDAMTYKPKTEAGQRFTKAISSILSVPAEVGKEVVDLPLESWKVGPVGKYLTEMAGEFGAYGLLDFAVKGTSAHVKNIVDSAKESKLRTRDPEAFRKFTDDASEGHPPVQMPVEKVDELLASKRMKPGDFFNDATEYYENKFEGDGGKVDIPVSDLAANAEHITPDTLKDVSMEGVPSENEMEAAKKAAGSLQKEGEGKETAFETDTDQPKGEKVEPGATSQGEIPGAGIKDTFNLAPSEGEVGKLPEESLTKTEDLFKKPTAEEQATTIDNLKSLNEDMGQKGEVDLSGVVDYLKKSGEEVKYTGDLQGDYYKLKNKGEVDRILTKRLLENAKGKPADYEAIYNWIEDPTQPITPAQSKIYKSEIEPIRKERERLFAKLRNEGVPVEGSEGYIPRFVAEHGGFFDRLVNGLRSSNAGAGILRKTAQSFKHRVMKAIEDEQGNRRIVSIKGDRVTAFEDGKSQDVGGKKSKANEELGDKKYFIDKEGKKWSIKEATTKEIEANTKLKYHKNALLNEIVTYNELKKVDRAIDYLENLKTSPEFEKAAIKLGTQNIPDGYKTTVLPQLRGYAFPDRMAETFDTFYKHVSQGLMEPSNLYSSINSFLRNAIFFNPLIHIPNISVHWTVNRGATPWLNPFAYPKLAKSSMRAIRAVLEMNDDYVQALEKGTSLLYSGVENRNLYDIMLKKMGKELESNAPMLEKLGKALGYANPVNLVKRIYKFSSEATWAVNDIATLQAVYEDMGNGMTMDKAITETGKHVPNYRIPPRVLNSTTVAKLMKPETGVTMFGAYHYGALKSYFEMAKSLVAQVPLKERAAALDKIAMLGIVTYVIYPQLDELAKKITGNEKAGFRRAGASTFLYKTEQFMKGTSDFPEWIQSVMTPSIGLTVGMETYMGRDPRTGEKLSPWRIMMNSIAPVSQAQRMYSGERKPSEFAASLVGISDQKTEAEKMISNFYGKRSDEEIEAGKVKKRIIKKMREGEGLDPDEEDAMAKMTEAQQKSVEKEAAMTPIQAAFSHMQDPTLEKSIKVWHRASDEERDQLRDMYEHRVNHFMMTHSGEEVDKINELIDKAEARK